MKHLTLLAVVTTLALASFIRTADATDRAAELCFESFAAKATGEVARLKADYAKIAPSDTRRSTDLRRLTLLRAMDQGIREPFLHGCGLNPSRQALKPIAMAMVAVDQWNQKQLQLMLDRIGWPVISRYGAGADQTAFLIVQHATSDLNFQRQILAKLEKLLAARETGGENYALLYDRVHETEGRMQRFGTQGDCHSKSWIPSPIEDSARVDKRRAALGMPPLAQSNANAERMYCRG